MTARFLINLRQWDHQISNAETDQWNTQGRGGDHTAIQFKRSEPRATQWTINDVLGDDPLLKPVEVEWILEAYHPPVLHCHARDNETRILDLAVGSGNKQHNVIYFKLTAGVRMDWISCISSLEPLRDRSYSTTSWQADLSQVSN